MKRVSRLMAVMVVGALLADPATASALAQGPFPAPIAYSNSFQVRFQEQAFVNVAVPFREAYIRGILNRWTEPLRRVWKPAAAGGTVSAVAWVQQVMLAAETAKTASEAAVKAAAEPVKLLVYKIQPGDTLSWLSKLWDVPIPEFEKANPQILNPDRIYAGNFLNIPVDLPAPPVLQDLAVREPLKMTPPDVGLPILDSVSAWAPDPTVIFGVAAILVVIPVVTIIISNRRMLSGAANRLNRQLSSKANSWIASQTRGAYATVVTFYHKFQRAVVPQLSPALEAGLQWLRGVYRQISRKRQHPQLKDRVAKLQAKAKYTAVGVGATWITADGVPTKKETARTVPSESPTTMVLKELPKAPSVMETLRAAADPGPDLKRRSARQTRRADGVRARNANPRAKAAARRDADSERAFYTHAGPRDTLTPKTRRIKSPPHPVITEEQWTPPQDPEVQGAPEPLFASDKNRHENRRMSEKQARRNRRVVVRSAAERDSALEDAFYAQARRAKTVTARPAADLATIKPASPAAVATQSNLPDVTPMLRQRLTQRFLLLWNMKMSLRGITIEEAASYLDPSFVVYRRIAFEKDRAAEQPASYDSGEQRLPFDVEPSPASESISALADSVVASPASVSAEAKAGATTAPVADETPDYNLPGKDHRQTLAYFADLRKKNALAEETLEPGSFRAATIRILAGIGLVGVMGTLGHYALSDAAGARLLERLPLISPIFLVTAAGVLMAGVAAIIYARRPKLSPREIQQQIFANAASKAATRPIMRADVPRDANGQRVAGRSVRPAAPAADMAATRVQPTAPMATPTIKKGGGKAGAEFYDKLAQLIIRLENTMPKTYEYFWFVRESRLVHNAMKLKAGIGSDDLAEAERRIAKALKAFEDRLSEPERAALETMRRVKPVQAPTSNGSDGTPTSPRPVRHIKVAIEMDTEGREIDPRQDNDHRRDAVYAEIKGALETLFEQVHADNDPTMEKVQGYKKRRDELVERIKAQTGKGMMSVGNGYSEKWSAISVRISELEDRLRNTAAHLIKAEQLIKLATKPQSIGLFETELRNWERAARNLGISGYTPIKEKHREMTHLLPIPIRGGGDSELAGSGRVRARFHRFFNSMKEPFTAVFLATALPNGWETLGWLSAGLAAWWLIRQLPFYFSRYRNSPLPANIYRFASQA